MAKRVKKKQKAPAPGPIKPPGPSEAPQQPDWYLGVGLIIATLLAYQAVWSAGFIWDDDTYVTNNAVLRSLQGLWQIWFVPGATEQYYPLTNTTFWLEYHLWQLDPVGYHVDNILLHIANALLLWSILRKLEVKGAWLAAALFALHPVGVESVAWVTERKNTLSGLFYLASLFAALKFWKLDLRDRTESTDPQSAKQWGFYWLALALYLMALCSKTATVPLPLVIILLLWWKRPTFAFKELYPLIPFFVIGVAMGLMTLWVERSQVGTVGADYAFSWPERFIIIGKAWWFYLGKLIWPYPLIFVYPRWHIVASRPLMYLPLLVALGGLLFLWLRRNTQLRPVFVAMIYFVLLLFPACGIFSLYFFRYSFVEDHLQYLACIGPLTLAAAGIVSGLDLIPARLAWLKPAACGVLLSLLGTLTWFQTQIYSDRETLWRTTIAQNPTAWMAYNNLGGELERKGQLTEAMEHYQQALVLNPDDAEAHNNIGSILAREGHISEAIGEFHRVFQLEPRNADAYYNLGNTFRQAGQPEKAIAQYQQAIKINPVYAEAHNNLGAVFAQEGRMPEAMKEFQEALRLDPYNDDAQKNIARAQALLKSKP